MISDDLLVSRMAKAATVRMPHTILDRLHHVRCARVSTRQHTPLEGTAMHSITTSMLIGFTQIAAAAPYHSQLTDVSCQTQQ
jgi:hypothetical protein